MQDAAVIPTTKKWVNSRAGRIEVISVPMFADGDTGGFGSITNGSRDYVFKSIANKLQAAGIADKVFLRLAWEANGRWYNWTFLKNPAGFRAAFRHIVWVMKKIAPDLRFEFNISNCAYHSSDEARWSDGYPGDDVISVISTDIYDQWISWTQMMAGDGGLYEVRKFAIAHNKHEAISEWACSTGSHGHGDNPGFVRAMSDWIDARPGMVLYQAYWNTSDPSNALIYGANPMMVPNASWEDKNRFRSTVSYASSTNTAPTISSISDRTIGVNSSTGAIPFSIGDAQTSASTLSIKTNVSDPLLIPLSRVTVGGSGSSRSITVTPVSNKTGWSTVWVQVSDGTLTKTTSFVVQVSGTQLSFLDVGGSVVGGNHRDDNGALTMYAKGYDIYNRYDQFHFAHVPIAGDSDLTVRVSSLTATNPWTKAGLMYPGLPRLKLVVCRGAHDPEQRHHAGLALGRRQLCHVFRRDRRFGATLAAAVAQRRWVPRLRVL